MYEDEYYYEARKKENAKLDAELAGTFATVIGGLIGAVLSCLLFLLRRFDVLSSGLASLLFYMLTYTREWHVAVYITVAFVIFIASMILQHAFLAGRIIFTIFVSMAVAIIGAGWKAYDTEIQRNTVMVICFTVTVILGLISWKGIKAQESFTEYYDGDRENIPDEYRVMDFMVSDEKERKTMNNETQAKVLRTYFDKCENQHLNAIWATEKLYIPGNSREQFSNVLEENLSLVYDSARLQEYEM